MAALNREDLLKKAGDLPEEEVILPGRDSVWIRGLNARDRDRFEASVTIQRQGRGGAVQTGQDFELLRAKLIVLCLLDGPGGSLMFAPNEYDLLGDLPAAVTDPMWDAATRLSGMGENDVEAMVEDFGATPDGSSSTPSPSSSGSPTSSLSESG